MTLKNRVALIVGGGNGLGRAIALKYAAEGATLVIADLNLDAANETLKLASQESSGLAARLDISDAAACTSLVQSIVARFDHLDILVNCAALCLVDDLKDVTPERWDKVFDINVRGAFFCMQAAAGQMMKQKRGRIIHITSPASKMGFQYFASYCASKAAVDSMVRSAAVGWAQHGITVNAIAPGRMTGGMIESLEVDLQRVTGRSAEELKAERTKGLPMNRRVEPSEVAAAAVWLASDEAAYVTAERFNFTGGMEV